MTATTTLPCPRCGREFKGKVGLGVHLSMAHPTTDAASDAVAPEPEGKSFLAPYTFEVLPVEVRDWTLKVDYETKTYEGVTFGATVKDGSGRKIGVIEDQGNGGGAWFMPVDGEGMRQWEAAVQAMATADPEGAGFASAEHLANALYENTAMYRDMNRKRNAVFLISPTAVTQVTDEGEIVEPDIRVMNKPLTDQAREWAKANLPAGTRVWIRNQGWEVL